MNYPPPLLTLLALNPQGQAWVVCRNTHGSYPMTASQYIFVNAVNTGVNRQPMKLSGGLDNVRASYILAQIFANLAPDAQMALLDIKDKMEYERDMAFARA